MKYGQHKYLESIPGKAVHIRTVSDDWSCDIQGAKYVFINSQTKFTQPFFYKAAFFIFDTFFIDCHIYFK